MGVTVVGSKTGDFPKQYFAPVVESRRKWSDEWTYDRELEVISGGESAGSSSVPSFEVRRRYGQIKLPESQQFETFAPRDMKNWWVRISFVDEQGLLPQFVGQVQDCARLLQGTDNNLLGMQNWVVSGGLRILQKIDVSEAFFVNEALESGVARVGWLPDMNAYDKRGSIVGNRSAEKLDGVYLYGGTSVWTHRQYIEYILQNFVEQEDGPTWRLAGQVDILDRMSTTVQFPSSAKVVDILQMLIPVRYGVDFRVRPTDDGFEVCVFALLSVDASAAGQTMPRNPNSVTINRGEQYDLESITLVESTARRVDRIRMLGRRIVVCGSLYGSAVSEVEASPDIGGKWSSELEDEYRELTDTDEILADEARSREKFKPVFQAFGAPAAWDLGGGRWAVKSDLAGQLSAQPGDFQNVIRSTLPWIPLKEGFDYRDFPPVDRNLPGHVADVRAPLVWLRDEEPEEGSPRYVQADLVGIGVSVPHNDWGVHLNPRINHLLAHGDWSSAEEETSDKMPRYDHRTLIATVAIESDHRLMLAYDVPDNLKAGDGSVMDVVDNDAEMWVLLPETIVDLDETGGIQNSPNETLVLRNDSDRLALLLAGLYMRYINDRVRATITIRGILPWGDLVGSILTAVQQGGDTQSVGAPITSIEWVFGDSPKTIIKTGYA